MIEELCTCDDLPAHSHFIGHEIVDGVMRPVYDPLDVGYLAVDWRAVARALFDDAPRHPGERLCTPPFPHWSAVPLP